MAPGSGGGTQGPLPDPASDVGTSAAPAARRTASFSGFIFASLCGQRCLNKRKRLCNYLKAGLSQRHGSPGPPLCGPLLGGLASKPHPATDSFVTPSLAFSTRVSRDPRKESCSHLPRCSSEIVPFRRNGPVPLVAALTQNQGAIFPSSLSFS